MDIRLEWTRPLMLEEADDPNMSLEVDLDALPDDAGVYVFARKWGREYEALYVGKAGRLRNRVRNQLNNHRLMNHVEQAGNGGRFLIAGRICPRPGQRIGTLLEIAERALIRHFLAEGHDLVNKQGTRIRRHRLITEGRKPRRFLQREMFVEA